MFKDLKKNFFGGKDDESKNPIFLVLKDFIGEEKLSGIEVVAAKLGLVLVMINSDMEFHEKEREMFEKMVKQDCNVNEETAAEMITRILDIPDTDFEIAYLTEVINNNLAKDDRKKILEDLFKIARADSVYDQYEDKYLRIISDSLQLERNVFLALKSRK